MRKLVSIAMCTYNGEAFIEEQLASILVQTRLPDEMIVCDDGSIDRTIEIIERFGNFAGFPVKIFRNEINLKPYKNFEKALSLTQGDVVFFCDQDDVWLPNKIETMLNAVRETENARGRDCPILVHSDLEIVDDQLLHINDSFYRFARFGTMEPDFVQAVTSNCVTGCAAAINAPLKRVMLPFPEQSDIADFLMHDWWAAICAAATGKILFVDNTLVRYRKHQSNAVGAMKKREKERFRYSGIKSIIAYAGKRRRASNQKLKTIVKRAKRVADIFLARRQLNPQSPHHQRLLKFAALDRLPRFERLVVMWQFKLPQDSPWKLMRRAYRAITLNRIED